MLIKNYKTKIKKIFLLNILQINKNYLISLIDNHTTRYLAFLSLTYIWNFNLLTKIINRIIQFLEPNNFCFALVIQNQSTLFFKKIFNFNLFEIHFVWYDKNLNSENKIKKLPIKNTDIEPLLDPREEKERIRKEKERIYEEKATAFAKKWFWWYVEDPELKSPPTRKRPANIFEHILFELKDFFFLVPAYWDKDYYVKYVRNRTDLFPKKLLDVYEKMHFWYSYKDPKTPVLKPREKKIDISLEKEETSSQNQNTSNKASNNVITKVYKVSTEASPKQKEEKSHENF
jgi:hypothetical protein